MGSHLRHTTTSMAPLGKVLTPDQIAAGQCPLCQQLLTDVQKSSGYYNVQNKGRFFQQVRANKHNEASCPGFWWRNDLATQTFIFQPHHCRQPACAGVGGTDLPNRKNNVCIWKACLGCCQAAARAAPEAAICKAPNHKLRSGASQPPIAGSTSTSITAPATPIRTKFAQSLSPTYAAKLANSGEDLPTLSGPGSASSWVVMTGAKIIIMPRCMEDIHRQANIVEVMVAGVEEMFQEMAIVVVENILRQSFGKLWWKRCCEEVLVPRDTLRTKESCS
ncbi:hypothetical protein DFH09DRAFT_1162941 [Mycena vulgaris]|nr:hypothetical protein DFH09DRAFT_1162941 [Mycena vulgaris]